MSSPQQNGRRPWGAEGDAAEGSVGSLAGRYLGRREIPGGLSSERTECCHDRRDQDVQCVYGVLDVLC